MEKSVKISKVCFLAIVLLFFGLESGCSRKGTLEGEKPYKDITPAQVRERLDEEGGLVILDVRTKEEYESETGHLPGAILIPVQELEKRYHELDSLKTKEIVAYCRSGVRSARASKFLGGKGFQVLNMLGGIRAWSEMKGESEKAK